MIDLVPAVNLPGASLMSGVSSSRRLGLVWPMPKPTRTLAALLRNLERHEDGLPGVDPVHDMRVATRRLRAALRLLGLRELDPPVKNALGVVRDLQLQIAWFKGRDAALYRSRTGLCPPHARLTSTDAYASVRRSR